MADGEIRFMGQRIKGQGACDLVKQGLVMVPESRGVFGRMTITENLLMGAYIREDDEVQADIAKVFAIFPRLKERALQLAGTMSGGEQQMLAMGRALAAPGPRRAGVAALSAGGGCQQRANGWLISGAMRGAIHARGTVQIGPPRPW